MPFLPQPQFGGSSYTSGLSAGASERDLEDDYFNDSPPSPSPLKQHLPADPVFSLSPASDLSAPPSVSRNQNKPQKELLPPEGGESRVPITSVGFDIQPRSEAPSAPMHFTVIPGFASPPIPKDFDVLAAQAPADDEVLGARCGLSFDGEDEDFDASPSRQRAGRIPNDHKEIIDNGIREIDAIVSKMHEETGRASENLINHYLASKGFKKVGRSVWNQYQKYFAAFRLQERLACGNPNAKCSEAFTHFRTRFPNWKEVLGQVDELIAQQDACVSGYRRRTAFNQFNQKLAALARVNHQTHGFQLFGIIMGNQPNTDQNLFSVIESPGAEGFMGDREENGSCAMYKSDFIGSFRSHINSAANKVHIEEFRSQQGQRDAGERPEVEVAGALLNPRRKEQQSEDKQTNVTPPAPSLPVPKPSKARSTSVVSSVSASEGSDTALRNVIRDFFHTRFKRVKVNISASAFPWKQLDKVLVTQGGIIFNYPNDVPFPNLSSDPTYTGPPCKPEGKNGTGIRSIGIPAMRRLAQACNDGEDGLHLVGEYTKKLLEASLVPWIVGPFPRDVNSPIRCLFYNGQAKMVPRQLLPQEWFSPVKQESLPTPKASSNKSVLSHRDSSPSRSRSSTPTQRWAKKSPPLPSQGFGSRPLTPLLEIPSARSPSPTLQDVEKPRTWPSYPVEETRLTCSPKPVTPPINLDPHPRALIDGASPTPFATIEQPLATSHESQHCSTGGDTPSSQPTTPTPVNITSSKRALEDAESRSLSSKRLKSLTPNPSGVFAGPPASQEPASTNNPPSPPDPWLPQGRPASPFVQPPMPPPQAPISPSKERIGDDVNDEKGLYSAAAFIPPPTMPVEVSKSMSDRSSMQPSPSMYQGSYPPPWQPGYGGYPPYGHPYYPPPPPQWGYTDTRPNLYQQEPQRDGTASGPTSTIPHHYAFQSPDAMAGPTTRPSHPPPAFYGRPDGAVYPPPFNPRFGSVPPSGFDHYGQMPPNFPPPTGMPPSGHSQMPPPSHSNMPPPSG